MGFWDSFKKGYEDQEEKLLLSKMTPWEREQYERDKRRRQQQEDDDEDGW
ncbi:MAG: hypothetical protein FWG65_03240 [Turicibacter sp.]|nr:hypothetical protein [Turicibacter sp.]